MWLNILLRKKKKKREISKSVISVFMRSDNENAKTLMALETNQQYHVMSSQRLRLDQCPGLILQI